MKIGKRFYTIYYSGSNRSGSISDILFLRLPYSVRLISYIDNVIRDKNPKLVPAIIMNNYENR